MKRTSLTHPFTLAPNLSFEYGPSLAVTKNTTVLQSIEKVIGFASPIYKIDIKNLHNFLILTCKHFPVILISCMLVPSVFIDSHHHLWPWWLARAITLVLILRHSIENCNSSISSTKLWYLNDNEPVWVLWEYLFLSFHVQQCIQDP